jgi:hypothetical protein
VAGDESAFDLTGFDRYVEEHGIPEEHWPAAFAQWIAELTDDRTNGVLALGLMLGVSVPGLASVTVASSWGQFGWHQALALGVAAGGISLVVLFVAFFAFCRATNCVV